MRAIALILVSALIAFSPIALADEPPATSDGSEEGDCFYLDYSTTPPRVVWYECDSGFG